MAFAAHQKSKVIKTLGTCCVFASRADQVAESDVRVRRGRAQLVKTWCVSEGEGPEVLEGLRAFNRNY